MYALNLTHSPEKPLILGVSRSFHFGRRQNGKRDRTSADCPPGVSDSIELHNGMQATRQATIKGSWGKAQCKYPSMATNVKRGASRWPRRE